MYLNDISFNDEYDVFICYKETDKNGQRTEESIIGERLYNDLTQKGICTFYGRESLKGIIGDEQECVAQALQTAKVMVAIGTDAEHYKDIAVKEQWSKFIEFVDGGEKRYFFLAYKNIVPSQLPREFNRRQGQNLDKANGYENLRAVIERLIDVKVAKIPDPVVDNAKNMAIFKKRGYDALTFGSFDEATDFAKKMIDIEYETADAYVILLLAELKLEKMDDLAECGKPFQDMVNFKKAVRFADDELRDKLNSYIPKSVTEDVLDDLEKSLKILEGLLESRGVSVGETENKVQTTSTSLGDDCYTTKNTWEIDANGVLRFPKGTKVINDCQFQNNDEIKIAILPESIETIGEYAFSGCSELEEINLPYGLKKIGEGAFKHSNLKQVVIPSTVKQIEKEAFCSCLFLKSVVIEDGVELIDDNAFNNCYLLETLQLSDSVREVGVKAFSFCSEIKRLKLPQSLEVIRDGAFSFLTHIESVKIPKSVKVINDEAFESCENLKKVSFEASWNGLICGGAFANCRCLSGFETEDDRFTVIDGNLYRDNGKTFVLYAPGKKEKSFTLPLGVLTIGQEAFCGNDKLEEIIIPNGTRAIHDRAFSRCKCLKKIIVPSSVVEIGNRVFKSCDALESVVLECDSRELIIGDGLFDSCFDLKNIKMTAAAFKCAGKSVGYSTKKLTIFGTGIIYSNCLGLNSIEELAICDGITEIKAQAFSMCSSLEKVEIPGSVEKIEDGAFVYCSKLKDVIVAPGCVKVGGSAFINCPLVNISQQLDTSCGESVTSVETGTNVRKETRTIGSFEGNSIEWIVLKEEGRDELLISKDVIPSVEYDKDGEAYCWDDCSLRDWLNGPFYETTFSMVDKFRIAFAEKKDAVFILSEDELREYFRSDEERQSHALCESISIGYDEETGEMERSGWWLKQTDPNAQEVKYVAETGEIVRKSDIDDWEIGVRPVIWIRKLPE